MLKDLSAAALQGTLLSSEREGRRISFRVKHQKKGIDTGFEYWGDGYSKSPRRTFDLTIYLK